MFTTLPSPAPSGYNSNDLAYGTWNSHFIQNLTDGLFAVALTIFIVALLIHWGRAALMGENPID